MKSLEFNDSLSDLIAGAMVPNRSRLPYLECELELLFRTGNGRGPRKRQKYAFARWGLF